MSNIGLPSFQRNICRTCLCKIIPSNSTSIFSDDKFYQDQTIRRALEEITYTIMEQDEKLPEYVCFECFNRLKNAIRFKKSIEKADKILRGKLRLAQINYALGHVDSVDSLLDTFCNEIYQTVNEHGIPTSTENKSCDTNKHSDRANQINLKQNTKVAKTVLSTTPKRNIKIINQTNKNNTPLTAKRNTKKKTEDLKSFSGREFIDNFLNQQDAKSKTEEKTLMSNSRSLYSQSYPPVKVYSNKNILKVKETQSLKEDSNKFIDKTLNHQEDAKPEIQQKPAKPPHSEPTNTYSNENVLKANEIKEEENQYILIVQEISNPIEGSNTVILQNSDLIKKETLNNVENLDHKEDEIVITENVPEIIEILDSPEPAIIEQEVSNEFATEMAWVQENLTNLGTICEDNKIGCKKCDKKFSIMEDKDEQDAKYNMADARNKTYTISLDTNLSPNIIPVPKVCKNFKIVKTYNHFDVEKQPLDTPPQEQICTIVKPCVNNKFQVNKGPQQQKCMTEDHKVKEEFTYNNTLEVEDTPQQEEVAVTSRKRVYLSSDNDTDDEASPRIKFSKKTWSAKDMIAAMAAYRESKMGYKQCSRVFGVPRSTLARYIKTGISNQRITNKCLGNKPIFSNDMEAEIVQYGLEIKKIFYNVSRIDLCKVAYDLSKVHNIQNKFNPDKKQAGVGWLNNFLGRNTQVIKHLSKPFSNTSNPSVAIELIKRFTTIYKTNLDEIHSNPNRLYSCYEMNGNAYSKQGRQQYNKILNLIPDENRTLVTSLVCFNAGGEFIPPLIVSPQRIMKPASSEGFPAGTIVKYNSYGWIQKNTFLKWLQHFINHVKPTDSDPVILIINSRKSYIKNIDTINIARANNILLTCLPPQRVYKMEPAERGQFVRRFKSSYKCEIKTWSQCKYEISADCTGRLFANAYLQTLSNHDIATEGFQMSGLFPFCVKTMLAIQNITMEDNENSEDESINNVNNNSEQNHIKIKENELVSCWIKEEPLVEEDVEFENASDQFNDQSDSVCENIKMEIEETNEVETYIERRSRDIEVKSESDYF